MLKNYSTEIKREKVKQPTLAEIVSRPKSTGIGNHPAHFFPDTDWRGYQFGDPECAYRR